MPDVVVVVEPDDVDVDVDVDTPVAVVVVPVLPVSLWPRPEPLREHPPKSHKAAKKTWRVCMLCPKKKEKAYPKKNSGQAPDYRLSRICQADLTSGPPKKTAPVERPVSP